MLKLIKNITINDKSISYYKGQIQFNITPINRNKKNILACSIHDTANLKAGAKNHFIYFNGTNRKSSADFFVDDKNIVQINDPYKYYTWSVGDRPKGTYYYGVLNKNSISIEICVNTDSDIKQTLLNVIELTKILMKEYNIPISMILRHYDITRKMCPGTIPMVDSTPYVNKNWTDFKNKIEIKAEVIPHKTEHDKIDDIDWKNGLNKILDRSDEWIVAIETKRELSELGYDLGSLNCMANLPTLIQLILNKEPLKSNNWEDIVKNVSPNWYNTWISGIKTAQGLAKHKSNLGDIEIMKFLPTLLIKANEFIFDGK